MTLNLIKVHFSCAISKDLVQLPYNCPCGHLFDGVNIFTWLVDNNTCPVSRLPLHMYDLQFNHTVYDFLRELRITEEDDVANVSTGTDEMECAGMEQSNSNDTGTQTDEFPPLIEPFVYLGNCEITIGNLGENERRYLGQGKMVDLANGLFNPASKNQHLCPVVERFNHEYITTLIPIKCDHPCIAIHKYCYQSRYDLVAVARLLCRYGYFVYDLFKIGTSDDLNRYVLYTAPVLITNQPVILSKYKRTM